MGFFQAGRSQLMDRLARAEPYIMQMLETAQGGLRQQRALIGDVGQEGYRSIQDSFTFGAGRLNQNFASRGFAGSSMHGAGFRGLASDVSRGFGNLTSQLAGVRSGMLRAALGDLMNAQSGAAGFQQGAGQMLNQSFMGQGQALLGVGHQPAQGVGRGWGQIGGFLGQALDEWIGDDNTPAATGTAPAPTSIPGGRISAF